MGKIVPLNEVGRYVKPWTASVIPGSFDLFHIGHLRAIKRSSEATRPMVVVVSSDERISKRKGRSRPIMSEAHRLELISALSFVDYAVLWKEPEHDYYLKAILPRRITFEKGRETYGEEQQKRLHSMITNDKPTEILLLPPTHGISTTLTIRKIEEVLREEDANRHTEHIKPFRAKPGQVDYTQIRWIPIINCVVKHEGKILIVQRSNEVAYHPAYWNGIAGFLDDNQSLEEKVTDELREELKISKENILEIQVGSIMLQDDPLNRKTWIVHPVLVEVKSQEITMNWEAQDYRWITLDELPQYALLPGFEDVVKSVTQLQAASAW